MPSAANSTASGESSRDGSRSPSWKAYGTMSGATLPQHEPVRKPTFPLSHASRQKRRRWPLAFRFIKGAIHHVILVPVIFHTLFTALIVYIDVHLDNDLGLPSSIVPSLSIVVGLMLVFRNSSSYERYWGGRTNLQTIVTSVRNLTRAFLVCGPSATTLDRTETEKTVRVLIAILYAVKNHLRGNWGVARLDPMIEALVPKGLRGHEAEGVGLPLELTYLVERYIKRVRFLSPEMGGDLWGLGIDDQATDLNAFPAPQSSMLSSQVNSLVDAFGSMETIKLTPIPVCHQIHQKQVLGLYCCVLPFCLVDEMGWWSVPLTAMVCFTLYGIEGIGEELEDPFGMDRNDIKIDAIIEDCRQEVMVLLDSWKIRGEEYYL